MLDASQKLKRLQTLLKEAVDLHFTKKDALAFAQREEREAWDKVNRLRNEISDMHIKMRDIIVTEHAFVRFFERILGYDLEKVKEEILPKQDRDRLMNTVGSRDWRVGDSHKVTIRDGKVITVLPPDPKPIRIRPILDDENLPDGDFGEVAIANEDSESWRGPLL